MFEKQEKYKCLALSTVHVRPETMEWLADQADRTMSNRGCDIVCYRTYSDGYIFTCLAWPDTGNNLPEELANIMREADKEGFDMLWLDGDAAENKNLPAFRKEWDAASGYTE